LLYSFYALQCFSTQFVLCLFIMYFFYDDDDDDDDDDNNNNNNNNILYPVAMETGGTWNH